MFWGNAAFAATEGRPPLRASRPSYPSCPCPICLAGRDSGRLSGGARGESGGGARSKGASCAFSLCTGRKTALKARLSLRACSLGGCPRNDGDRNGWRDTGSSRPGTRGDGQGRRPRSTPRRHGSGDCVRRRDGPASHQRAVQRAAEETQGGAFQVDALQPQGGRPRRRPRDLPRRAARRRARPAGRIST